MAIFSSPLGSGFFIFFQVFRESPDELEVVEIDLSIARKKETVVEIQRSSSHTLEITRQKES